MTQQNKIHTASLAQLLKKKRKLLADRNVTAGFDGFIDTIVNIVKDKPSGKPPVYFNTKRSFADYINRKKGSSFSLEMEEIHVKAGGNMPILANGLGHLGVKVNCIGALGMPQVEPIFRSLSPNCNLLSFCKPGISTAMEFKDGKIILGEMRRLNSAGWDEIKARFTIKKIIDLYKNSHLLCLVNWAEIDASGDIWNGILTEVLPRYKYAHGKQSAFFDLSDCSKRSRASIRVVLGYLKQFSSYCDVTLGLNHNETTLIYKVLFPKGRDKELVQMGLKIFNHLSINTLILHSSKTSVAINREGFFNCDSFFTPQPFISTGAGDNFNAGFCSGKLMELPVADCLLLAHAVSGCYIRSGVSPTMDDVIKFLNNQ